MKALVAYLSSTGNTKKIAEAICDEIRCDKDIMKVDEVQEIGSYDISFLGFPVHGYGPDKKTKEFLAKHCTDGRKVALFITHAAPEGEPELPETLAKFKQAAAGAELQGVFDCQGELAKGVKFIMKIAPNKKMRSQAKMDNSKGQPDAARVEKARAFARETMSRMDSLKPS
jgi:flavodoxin